MIDKKKSLRWALAEVAFGWRTALPLVRRKGRK